MWPLTRLKWQATHGLFARRLAGFLGEDQDATRYGRCLAQMDWELVPRLLRPAVLDAAADYDPLSKD